jgi:pyruvate/2-oxoglutarate dehydrogenase complex dihydrolipoamide acyltransferase (E2) component
MARKDAFRIKKLNGMEQLMLDIKPRRCDSDVYINHKMDVTELVEYIQKKKAGGDELTYFHAFVTALGKVIYNRRKLNRFIANRHVWEHKEIVISFVAKETFSDKAEEIMIMVPFNENDNIYTIAKLIKDKVEKVRGAKKAKKEGANSAIDIIGKLPNIIRVPLVGFLKWLDKFGMLPQDLMKDNLYYSSMIVSNLGSIKCGAIYHNITDFGTCSSLATFGEIKDEIVMIDGKEQVRKICEFGINIDERVADGFYFAKCIKMCEHLFKHPEMLEEKVGTKIEIGNIR